MNITISPCSDNHSNPFRQLMDLWRKYQAQKEEREHLYQPSVLVKQHDDEQECIPKFIHFVNDCLDDVSVLGGERNGGGFLRENHSEKLFEEYLWSRRKIALFQDHGDTESDLDCSSQDCPSEGDTTHTNQVSFLLLDPYANKFGGDQQQQYLVLHYHEGRILCEI
jgi:hypothetical protein